MRRNELIKTIANSANLTVEEAGRALETMLDAISCSLAKGRKVMLTGFGTFSVVRRKNGSRKSVAKPDGGKPLIRVLRFTSGVKLYATDEEQRQG
ncbi:MAG: HU family DNA-binding protein [Alphaproteobacteria bacterium]|uniref:HU family DNA-binding protein n=1 Tax=Candidatus Nitrobium versatile TaxID=2884831 RepID=A0A953JGP6_9BACT|nr:HU family DNA-binding protein [Candidatus Nitrobium versatile]